jgi:hypothetical protein
VTPVTGDYPPPEGHPDLPPPRSTERVVLQRLFIDHDEAYRFYRQKFEQLEAAYGFPKPTRWQRFRWWLERWRDGFR